MLGAIGDFTVRGQRTGRIAFGAVLIAGAAVMVGRICGSIGAGPPRVIAVLAGTWTAAFIAYAVAGALASRRRIAREDELAIASFVAPSVGAALLLPITLHAPFVIAASGDLAIYDDYAAIALFGTSPTHLAFAWLAGRRARDLVRGVPATSPRWIYGACCVISCVPFIVYVFPPLVVALTGMPLAALMFRSERLVERDRRRGRAEAADGGLPRAVALAARAT